MFNNPRSRSFVLLISISVICLAEVEIVKRSEWNARESKVELDKLNTPVSRVIIAHTAGAECSDTNTCVQQMRGLQRHHMDKMGFDDIAYNFLIGNDGKVYEGRGWDYIGAFARNFNSGSYGIAFIGNFELSLPSQAALDAAKSLLEMGKTLNKITNDFKLYGHRQISPTLSPGSALYETIKKWPNWSPQLD